MHGPYIYQSIIRATNNTILLPFFPQSLWSSFINIITQLQQIPKMWETQIFRAIEMLKPGKTTMKYRHNYSLFQTLNEKIEKQNQTIKSRSASTRSFDESDEEISASTLKTLRKIAQYSSHNCTLQQTLGSKNVLLGCEIDNQGTEILCQIKTQASSHALQLNQRFESIAQNTIQQLTNKCDISIFVKQFDKCFEMIQALQSALEEIKTNMSDFSDVYKDDLVLEGLNEQKIFQVYTQQIIQNCPLVVNLSELIESLLGTSIFENQSSQIIQSLQGIVNLTRKSRFQEGKPTKSSLASYKEMFRRIRDFQDVQYRVPIILSQSFLQGMKRKYIKTKKHK